MSRLFKTLKAKVEFYSKCDGQPLGDFKGGGSLDLLCFKIFLGSVWRIYKRQEWTGKEDLVGALQA